ncbi:alpha/beta hydrolase [Xylaria bambusicola]|uniref:alpha/beta hydrolase n=1 Tax=Xylaria bambusicola TaxID=326684 RepID=UPI00200738AF|nr:alpha/beta hydrolase [Xylaria bambusicola]KAI0528314.1 alpha/beta hydrolase [Xylaria bambusicola]
MKLITTAIVVATCVLVPFQVFAQAIGTITNAPQDGDLNGSNFTYPWPVKLFQFSSQLQKVEMAFMDVDPTGEPNGRVAVCLHGKNFCAPTWESTARVLAEQGYRIILIDQIGFCKSAKPNSYQYTLQQLSYNTNSLLHALGIGNITLIGHSLGGMTSIRYGLMYPETINELVLVNPIGLEDWKALGVPYRDIETLYASEVVSNYTTIRAYQQATYYVNTWDASYDVWVNMLANIYAGTEAPAFAFDQALTTDMALSAPVVYEFGSLKPRTLLMIGDKDNTALGKQWSPPEVQEKLGHYDVLGKQAAAAIPNADLVEFPDLGHAPQIQDPDRFHAKLLGWLSM